MQLLAWVYDFMYVATWHMCEMMTVDQPALNMDL